jgi:hypothetical protein
MDAGAYSISRWGAARAAMRGVRVREFRHHDVQALHAHMANDAVAAIADTIGSNFPHLKPLYSRPGSRTASGSFPRLHHQN